MAYKTVTLPDIGEVKLYKRNGARNIRLSIASNGDVRVTLPSWAPYIAGKEFAATKAAWILANRPAVSVLESGRQIGKAHRLYIVRSEEKSKISTKIVGSQITISTPSGYTLQSPEVQKAANSASVRALKKEANHLLPQRLRTLAEKYGFSYKTVKIKQLKGRWGSCDQQTNITLNCYLMELPWELIDYVLIHELVHTKIMAHGPVFWAEVDKYVTDLPRIRSSIRAHRPLLRSS